MTGRGGGDDPTAEFEALTLPHLGVLYGFAVSRLRDAHAAEDMVQETCLKAYRAFVQFERGTDYKAWLFRILVNTIVDYRRKAARTVPSVSLETVEGGSYDAIAPARDPERRLLASEVRAALEALSPEWHAVVHLSFVEGFSYKEIAGILGCPIGTVMSRLYRARQALRERLAPRVSANGASARPAAGTRAVASLDLIRARLQGRRGTKSE